MNKKLKKQLTVLFYNFRSILVCLTALISLYTNNIKFILILCLSLIVLDMTDDKVSKLK